MSMRSRKMRRDWASAQRHEDDPHLVNARQVEDRLEAFVESGHHRGTCYKAANWVHVGQTAGRGKQSTAHRQIIPIRDIWLYPLRRDFADVLCG